ncbi:hypothetical protein B4113_2561 [Geobacillus sp. B4113_201601]|nr:hypothetical protein B4113_2561 [Geobacillus sp. B4113_201601]
MPANRFVHGKVPGAAICPRPCQRGIFTETFHGRRAPPSTQG